MDAIAALNRTLSGRYQIEREIGAGGMANVYAARDMRHDRLVALKVLKPELGAMLGVERFLAEIRVTANLQHPNLLPLFDSGEADGLLFYVMPLVDGETLRARLSREGQLSVNETVRIASGVAAALDYAHRHGVIHRDLKPENVLLHDGQPLVADFGIALAVSKAGGDRLTQTGLSLGTPQYMAPEQAMGERVIDKRADVYALAAMTYEMLAGEAPFTGPNAQAILARVMTESPRSLSTQRRTIPLYMDEAVRKGLEKIPADRQESISEFAGELASPTAGSRTARVAPRPRWVVGAIAVAAALITAGVLAGRQLQQQSTAAIPPSRLALVAPHLGSAGGIFMHREIAITPNGGTLIYESKAADGEARLVRQSLADAEPTQIAGLRPGLAALTISRDGRWLVGMAMDERQAYLHPIDGGAGAAMTLPGGYTDFVQADGAGMMWVSPSNGGGIIQLTRGDTTAHLVGHSKGMRLQQILPDGRHALVMRESNALSSTAAVFDMQSGDVTPLMPTQVAEVRYAAGYVVFVLPNGVLEAAPFDLAAARVTAAPVVIGSNVALTGTGVAQFAVASNGTVAYIVEEPPSLVIVSRDGTVRPALDALHNYHAPRFSPDGRHVSADFNTATGRDVWTLSLTDGALAKATFSGDGHDATWTPDGRYITYLSNTSGAERIYKKRWAGNDSAQGLFTSPQLGFTGVWLPDGSGLVSVVNDVHPGSGADIVLIGNGGKGPAIPLAATEYTESYPTVSPDGRWFAYTSDQSGRLEVYARALTGESDQILISRDGGAEPAWSEGGREIFYRNLDDRDPQLIAAAIRYTPSLTVVSRRPLFSVIDIMRTQPHAGYDVSPDGKRFVMVRRTPASRIMILQNLAGLVAQSGGTAH